MKKLIAISSLLALVLAGSGLFAVDIPVGDGGGKFTLDLQAEYEFDIITDANEKDDNDKTWIQELDADKQAKVSVAASYDGDNYAFGVGFKFEQKYASHDDGKKWDIDDAWGKYYLLNKQLWLRGGSMDGLWRIDTDPLNKNYGGNNGPGLQINFSPSALTGLNVGVALPVPGPNSRRTVKAKDAYWKWVDKDGKDKADASLVATDKAVYVPAKSASWTTWGPTYPLMNAAFGLRLKDTIPGLDIGTELDLLGNEYTNGKLDDTDPTNDADEKEGDFMGMNFHLTAVYTFAPVTLRAALLVEGIANGVQNAPEPLTSVGARLIFDIPNGEGSALDLGDPWVQFQMLPNEYVTLNNNWGKVRNDDGYLIVAAKEEKSFKDILIDFEWEPSYSLSDSIKAYLWLGVGYKVWADAPDNSDQKKYPLTVAVRPALEFKFAPSATLKIQDKVSFVRQAKEKGLKNELGLRFAWKF